MPSDGGPQPPEGGAPGLTEDDDGRGEVHVRWEAAEAEAQSGWVEAEVSKYRDNAEAAAEAEAQDSWVEAEVAKYRYNAEAINEEVFELLDLPPETAQEVQAAWAAFLQAEDSREVAGEAIYSAIFEAAPTLQSLFKTPRAMMSMRFLNGLHHIFTSADDPATLKVHVETLGFQHMDMEVTTPRILVFRDAILDVLQLDLGEKLSILASEGIRILLNYVGGALIYVKRNYTGRLKVLASSWAAAHERRAEPEPSGEESGTGEGEAAAAGSAETTPPRGRGRRGARARGRGGADLGGSFASAMDDFKVPTTYLEMFEFNTLVMGFTGRAWMHEVLTSFDAIVVNVSSPHRLQEECEVLSLRISRLKGSVHLSEYRAVMLASLRSLLLKKWDSEHEVAWSWLWENVERMLQVLLGKLAQQHKSLSALLSGLGDAEKAFVRREVYTRYFRIAPVGMDYFKQSTTRLHFIADKVVGMTLDVYREPDQLVKDLSLIGLRHVGYGVPPELCAPLVTACVQVVMCATTDALAIESFRWALNLIARILMRVIKEGSTVVMRAINLNCGRQMKRAVDCAPRSERAAWVLNLTVGSQSISPLMWAIETSSLEAAAAIIGDLVTIRADRGSYYYGVAELFRRHPNVIGRLCNEAPGLLVPLLDGLVWRSRLTDNGRRRVVYFVERLLVGPDGGFAQATEWLTGLGDPKVVCHPAVALVTDLVWRRVAGRAFLYRKAWLLLTLAVCIASQAVLNRAAPGFEGSEEPFAVRCAILACRCFLYISGLGVSLVSQVKRMRRDFSEEALWSLGPVRLPACLAEEQGALSLVLSACLLAMLASEPILHCMRQGGPLFAEHCGGEGSTRSVYSVFSMGAVFCYCMLLKELANFSTRLAALLLVMGRMLADFSMYLGGVAFITVVFGSAISALEHDQPLFRGPLVSAATLLRIALGMLRGSRLDKIVDSPPMLVAILLYFIVVGIVMFNLLIAMLSCAYATTYQDMVGHARLKLGAIIVAHMPSVPAPHWEAFVASLELGKPCEFVEGDVGLAGGLQGTEPAQEHAITQDVIHYYGGPACPEARWPKEPNSGDGDMEDRIASLEGTIQKTLKRLNESGRRAHSTSSGTVSHHGSSAGGSTSERGTAEDVDL